LNKYLKARWARKLIRAKYFVVLTDTESVISMDGVDPGSFTDVIALQAQLVSVKEFEKQVAELRKRHEKMVVKLSGGGVTSSKPKNRSSNANQRSKTTKNASKTNRAKSRRV
jgi:hypothetical protein